MALLIADHHFHISNVHLRTGKPCQDYALSGNKGEAAFAIVSDGCSMGGYTDMGSRVMAFSTAAVIKRYVTVQEIMRPEETIRSINAGRRVFVDNTRSSLHLEWKDLLATCAYACITPDGGFIYLQGDGVIARVYDDGIMIASSFAWAKNTPFYPAYDLEDNCVAFIAEHGNDLHTLVLTEHRACFYPGQGWSKEIVRHSLEEGIVGITLSISSEEMEHLSFAALFSDGVMQVTGHTWTDVITDLLEFKSRYGDFAKRRMIRFVKDVQKNGGEFMDDLAYAVVQVIRESEGE